MKEKILIQRIEEVTASTMTRPRISTSLSQQIFFKTEEMVSPSTLKRLWGYIDSASSPRSYTLDVLARFLGYRDYEAFKVDNEHADVQSDITLCDKVSCEDLVVGDLLELNLAAQPPLSGGVSWRRTLPRRGGSEHQASAWVTPSFALCF